MTLAVEKRMPSANLADNHNAMREINDTEWAEFAARRPGLPFFIAVLSTGIFCRSGCPANSISVVRTWRGVIADVQHLPRLVLCPPLLERLASAVTARAT